jgi:hypothetical protein
MTQTRSEAEGTTAMNTVNGNHTEVRDEKNILRDFA